MTASNLMPRSEPVPIGLYCSVCGKECRHWRDLFDHWDTEHKAQYEKAVKSAEGEEK